MNKGEHMTLTEQFENQDKALTSLLTPKEEELGTHLNELPSFIVGIPDNLIGSFGEFLISSLGDRVNGSRKTMLNETFMASETGQKIIAEFNAHKDGYPEIDTLEKYLAKTDNHYRNPYDRSTKTANRTTCYLSTAPNGFGYTYVTPAGRMQTAFITAHNLFEYLQPEHATLLSNKRKRECVEVFLDYRKWLLGEEKTANLPVIFDVPIDVTVIQTDIISSSNKRGDKYGNSRTYMVENNRSNTQIDRVNFNVSPLPNVFHNLSSVNTERLSSNYGRYEIVIDLEPATITQNEKGENIDMGYGMASITKHGFRNPLAQILRKDNSRQTSLKTKKVYEGDLLDWMKVMEHPQVVKAIQDRVKYYENAFDKLTEIKHEFADLYFAHSDF
jgi:hypothetical protein